MTQQTILLSRQAVEEAYKDEKDPQTKLRMLLVLNSKYDGESQNQAARELRSTSSWASKWIGRFAEQGLEGLKTKQRSGRPPKLDHRTLVKIKRKVVRNECGWSVKEVRELIRKEGHVVYTERHILRLMQKWGIRGIVPETRLLRKAPIEERLAFKKEPKGFSTISLEASR